MIILVFSLNLDTGFTRSSEAKYILYKGSASWWIASQDSIKLEIDIGQWNKLRGREVYPANFEKLGWIERAFRMKQFVESINTNAPIDEVVDHAEDVLYVVEAETDLFISQPEAMRKMSAIFRLALTKGHERLLRRCGDAETLEKIVVMVYRTSTSKNHKILYECLQAIVYFGDCADDFCEAPPIEAAIERHEEDLFRACMLLLDCCEQLQRADYLVLVSQIIERLCPHWDKNPKIKSTWRKTIFDTRFIHKIAYYLIHNKRNAHYVFWHTIHTLFIFTDVTTVQQIRDTGIDQILLSSSEDLTPHEALCGRSAAEYFEVNRHGEDAIRSGRFLSAMQDAWMDLEGDVTYDTLGDATGIPELLYLFSTKDIHIAARCSRTLRRWLERGDEIRAKFCLAKSPDIVSTTTLFIREGKWLDVDYDTSCSCRSPHGDCFNETILEDHLFVLVHLVLHSPQHGQVLREKELHKTAVELLRSPKCREAWVEALFAVVAVTGYDWEEGEREDFGRIRERLGSGIGAKWSNLLDLNVFSEISQPTGDHRPERICHHPGCSQRAKNKCSRCHAVRYCSKTCQQGDWQRHRADCGEKVRRVKSRTREEEENSDVD
ncbi:hypothetical protein PROFUN_11341 [Planoprotostelium fungivorum]|uniref:MYND-type domain-containing protein n=1 Tax=Planoprotostelium fungivorum TaxID=1890364 RepID=A0A2P6NAD1_9EUKA|nr:hypothetical protein PROFUN_11341 [Planoprotostelium fungivorum]